jgi:hypothetical protein
MEIFPSVETHNKIKPYSLGENSQALTELV